MAFAPTHATLDALRAKGAGPHTLAAISALISRAGVAENPAPRGQAGPNSQKPRLTRAQLEQMLRNHGRDDLVARQVRSSAPNFQVTKKIVDELAAKGAGPETVAALREQIRSGIVEIQTAPGSQVFLDGEPAGTVGEGGFLAVEDVLEGNHELVAKNEGFRDGNLKFSIANQERKRLTLPLDWLGGFLSVTAKPDGARIAVSGPKSFEGGAADIECPPGNYTATVSLDGYISQSRSFPIAAGEHHNEAFALAFDPAVVVTMISGAKSKLNTNDPAGAANLAETVLRLQPGNADAEAVLAVAAFQQGDMNRFVDAGTKAIRSGKPVTVRIMHAHTLWALWMHPVDLTISGSGLSLAANPPDNRCKMPASLDFNLIANMQLIRDPQHGFPELHVQYASKPHGAILHDLNFVPDGSEVVSQKQPGQVIGGTANLQTPANTEQILDGILRLMIRARR